MTGHVGSVAGRVEPGVAVSVADIKGPAAGAHPTDDARRTITFLPPELEPASVRIDFLVYSDPPIRDQRGDIIPAAEPVEYEYVMIDCGLDRPISISEAEADPEAIHREAARTTALFRDNLDMYRHQGELLLRFKRGELADVRRALIGGKAHKYHPLLVADLRSRPRVRGRTAAMATAFHVDRSIIWRELQECLAEGLISEDEIERRKPRTPASASAT